MPSQYAQGGFGLTFELNSIVMVGIIDIDAIKYSRTFRDITGHDSEDGYEDAEPTGRRRLEPLVCTLAWDRSEATHAAVVAAFNSNSASWLKWRDPLGRESIAFSAHISAISRISAQEEVYQAIVEIRPIRTPFLRDYDYSARVLSVEPDDLVVYFPLWEEAGIVADNLQGDASGDGEYQATYVLGEEGIGDSPNLSTLLDAGGTPGGWVKTYTSYLNNNWDPDEGSIMLWMKAKNAGVWTNNANMALWRWYVDGNNFIYLKKMNGASNELSFQRRGSGTYKNVDIARTDTDFMCLGMSWSVSDNKMKIFINGEKQGTTQTGISAFASSTLVEASSPLGAASNTPDQEWNGWVAHAAHWSKVLTPLQFAHLGVLI